MAITGIDHVVVGVRDLDAARADWQRLGFTCTPKGRHRQWATANHCLMLADDYIELLGISGPGDSLGLDAFLKDREGLRALSWATPDADLAARAFAGAGLGGGPVRELERGLDLPEGETSLRFRLAYPAEDASLGLSSFACQHLTPDQMRLPGWADHPNTAKRLRAVTVAVADPAPVAQTYAALFGPAAVHNGPQGVTVRVGPAVVHFGVAQDGITGMVGLAVEVADLAAATAVLESAGVAHTPTPQGLTVAPVSATGVVLTFLPG